MSSWSEHRLVRDGVRLVCRDRGGPGQPLVLLHGLAGSAGEWDGIAGRLSSRYRVVAVDLRGHGDSERRPGDVSRAAHVADVLAVLDALELEPAVLVGQSLGGHTAMLTAAAHPGRVRGLVLVEAGAGGPSPDVGAEVGGWLDSWPTPFATRESAARFLGGGPVGEGWAAGLEERDGGWWPRFDTDIMVGSLAELGRRAFWDEWERVTSPVLVVLAQSGFIPPAEVDEMFLRRPATVGVSVPGAGHDLHLEQPDTLCARIVDFVEGLGTTE
ncbi:alpha/beta hydrolase [Streptomyces sp. NPDC050738]|uniref:alpha/beta fold hydrolase n=1 Tax=Streptomyces sp. NPDC050738 TaxID=3154744 RepID=UPI00343D52EA